MSSCASDSDLRRCTQGNQLRPKQRIDRPADGLLVTPSPRRVRFPALLPAPSRKPPPCWGYLRHFPMSSPNTAGVCTTSGGWRSSVSKTLQQYVGPLNSFTPTPTNYSEPHHSKCLLKRRFSRRISPGSWYLTAPSASPMTLCFCQRKSAIASHRQYLESAIRPSATATPLPPSPSARLTQGPIPQRVQVVTEPSPADPLPTAHLSEAKSGRRASHRKPVRDHERHLEGRLRPAHHPRVPSNHLARGRVCDGQSIRHPA